MSIRAMVAGIVGVLALSACGGRQTFIQAHTACESENYTTPAWSPDGTRIYYTVGTSSYDYVHVMNNSGGNDGVVASLAGDPSPSPDGRWLLFQRRDPANSGSPEYHLRDLTSNQDRNLGDLGSSPSWSPDGRWIAYRAASGGPVRKMDVASGQSVALTAPPAGMLLGDVFALWSPDGKHIAFISDRDGAQGLYLMDADGGNVTLLAGPDDPACNVTNHYPTIAPRGWRPDGKTLAFTRVCDDAMSLHLVGLDGGEIADLGYLSRNPITIDWSPGPGSAEDGKQVLVAEDEVIYVANADGSALRVLRKYAYDPRWSPDGQRIVFGEKDYPTGLHQIYSMAADGSGAKQLTDNPGARSVCLH